MTRSILPLALILSIAAPAIASANTIDDRRGRVDDVAGVVGPEKLQGGGRRACRDTRETRGTAELAPFIGRCNTRRLSRDAQKPRRHEGHEDHEDHETKFGLRSCSS